MDIQYEYNGCFDRCADYARQTDKEDPKKIDDISVDHSIPQRNYFPFYDYEYCLDVTHQYEIMSGVTPIEEGLYDAFQWYKGNKNAVNRKPLIDFIDNEISKRHG